MLKLLSWAQAYLKKEDGATAIEYGLIAAGISLVIAGTVFAFGGQLNALFAGMGAQLLGGGGGG